MLRVFIPALAGVLLSAQEPDNIYTKEKEAEIGAAMAHAVRNSTTPIGDSTVQDYVGRLGRQLTAHFSGGDFDWDFAMIRDNRGGSTHEPISVPAGHIFVPAFLFLAAESEAEFAGMLAHSMAHVAERHATRMATRGPAAKHGQVANLILAGGPGDCDGALIPAEYLPILRNDELDADRIAVNTLAAAGYDPVALRDYVRRTQRASTARSGICSVLPPREERISALETALVNLPNTGRWSSGEFNAIRNRVRELTAPRPSAPRKPPTLLREDEQ